MVSLTRSTNFYLNFWGDILQKIPNPNMVMMYFPGPGTKFSAHCTDFFAHASEYFYTQTSGDSIKYFPSKMPVARTSGKTRWLVTSWLVFGMGTLLRVYQPSKEFLLIGCFGWNTMQLDVFKTISFHSGSSFMGYDLWSRYWIYYHLVPVVLRVDLPTAKYCGYSDGIDTIQW